MVIFNFRESTSIVTLKARRALSNEAKWKIETKVAITKWKLLSEHNKAQVLCLL